MRVVLVVISLISGSSVALLGPKTRGEARNPAAVARGGRLYCGVRVGHIWHTSIGHLAYQHMPSAYAIERTRIFR